MSEVRGDAPSLRESPAEVLDLDALRTLWHDRAVIASARKRGEDPEAALARSREMRAFFLARGTDIRVSIQSAMKWAEDGDGRRARSDKVKCQREVRNRAASSQQTTPDPST